MWHVSISWEQRPTARWPLPVRKRVRRWARQLLSGVGQERTHEQWGQICYHWRKPLSAAEIAGLDPAWLALPVADEA